MAATKEVQVRAGGYLAPDGTQAIDGWNTLPGASGEMSREALEIDDSILGQEYQSQEVGLINWTVTGSAIYKGFAGYEATIKSIGTIGATMDLTGTRDGETQWWDMGLGNTQVFTDTTISTDFNVTGSNVKDTDIDVIDYLTGRVRFAVGKVPTAVTLPQANVFTLATLGRGMTFTLNMSADPVENTTFAVAQSNAGFRTYQLGLKTVGLDISGIFGTTPDFVAKLVDRKRQVIEINPSGDSESADPSGSTSRGLFYLVNQGQSGDVGALEEETLTFSLSVPSSEYVPFKWVHPEGTNLPVAAETCLSAFIDSTEVGVRYLHSGGNGWVGNAIVTEASLEGGLDVMNEFRITLQGTGAHVNVAA